MKEPSQDTTRFEISPKKYLIFVVNSLDKIKNILKTLNDKDCLTDLLYKNITPSGCRPRILYDQAEIQKLVVSNSSCFRAILDANTKAHLIFWLNSLLDANFEY